MDLIPFDSWCHNCHTDSEALKHIIERLQTVTFTKHDCMCLIRFAAWFILFVFANATCFRQQVPLDKLFWWKMSRGQNWSATCQAEQMRKGSKEHIELHWATLIDCTHNGIMCTQHVLTTCMSSVRFDQGKLVDVREVREPEWPYGTL